MFSIKKQTQTMPVNISMTEILKKDVLPLV